MAAYQQWKASNELSNLVAYEQAAVATAAPVKQAAQKAPVRKTTTPARTTEPKTTTSTSGSGDVAQGSGTSTSSGEAKAEEKKKISKAAKGAVIGGVAGAAGGAILNKKNRVMGAVIGGVIGAAGGYGIGRGMDKKDGRFEYQLK
jgi:hypothetical protein